MSIPRPPATHTIVTAVDDVVAAAGELTGGRGKLTDAVVCGRRLLEIGRPEVALSVLEGRDVRSHARAEVTWVRALFEARRWDALDAHLQSLSRRDDEIDDDRLALMLCPGAWRAHRAENLAQMEDVIERVAILVAAGSVSVEARAELAHLEAFHAYRFQGDCIGAEKKTDSAIAWARESGNRVVLTRTLILRSILAKVAGLLTTADLFAREALEVASATMNHKLIQDALRHVAIFSYRSSRFDEALEAVDFGLSLHDEFPDLRFAASLRIIRVRTHLLRGEIEIARGELSKAAGEAAEDPRLQELIVETSGMERLASNRPGEALDDFDLYLNSLIAAGVHSYEVAEALLRRAQALLELGEYQEVVDVTNEALATIEGLGQGQGRGHLLRVRGVAERHLGRMPDAATTLYQAERELRRVGDLYELGLCLIDEARLTDTPEQAVRDAAEAANIFARIGVAHRRQEAEQLLSGHRGEINRESVLAILEGTSKLIGTVTGFARSQIGATQCPKCGTDDVMVTGEGDAQRGLCLSCFAQW